VTSTDALAPSLHRRRIAQTTQPPKAAPSDADARDPDWSRGRNLVFRLWNRLRGAHGAEL